MLVEFGFAFIRQNPVINKVEVIQLSRAIIRWIYHWTFRFSSYAYIHLHRIRLRDDSTSLQFPTLGCVKVLMLSKFVRFPSCILPELRSNFVKISIRNFLKYDWKYFFNTICSLFNTMYILLGHLIKEIINFELIIY